MNRLLILSLALVGAIAGCFVVPANEDSPDPDGGAGAGTQARVGENAASSCAQSGLPAAVQAMLTTRCQGCHSAGGSTPMALDGYDDLLATAASDPSRTVAAVVLERIQSNDAPMPPSRNGVTVPQDQIDAFRMWLEAGTPTLESDACAPGKANPDGGRVAIASVCTSGLSWEPGGGNVTPQRHGDDDDRFGPRMNPGRACIDCHNAKEDEPILQVGGTVYPTLREPDLCWGAGDSGAQVIVIDANGREWPMPLTDTGNFSWSTDDEQIVFPITAKVVTKDGRERVMNTPQTSGDCNSCHSEQGRNNAPGRIFLP